MTNQVDELIGISIEGPIAIVTLQNPARRNAFSPAMRDQMIPALRQALEDTAVRSIVLTGAANTFCAGGDISTWGTSGDGTLLEYRGRMARYHELLRLMVAGPKPLVAAVEGHAYGAGMSLALACDYVVAASNAKFCSAFARVALIPDVGLLWTLPQRVGMAKAKELITLAVEFDGVEAGRLGAVNQVVEPGAALTAALAIAHRYAEMAPVAFALAKAAFADGSVNTLEGAMHAELNSQSTLRKTSDHRAAAQAFLEKRKVSFIGD